MQGGGLAATIGEKLVMPIGRLGESLVRKSIGVSVPQMYQSLTKKDWSEMAQEVSTMDPAAIGLALQLKMPEAVSAEVKAQVQAQVQAAIDIIKSANPKYAGDITKAVVDPGGVIQNIIDGKRASREQISTLDKIYSGAMEQLRTLVSSGDHNDQVKFKLGLSTPKLQASMPRLQGIYAQGRGDAGKKSTRSLGSGQASMTRMQKIAS
jgi:hypothetical protein